MDPQMSAAQKIDDEVGVYPAPLRLVADTPNETRWPNSPTSAVFSFAWKPESPSSSDGDISDNQRSDHEEGSSSGIIRDSSCCSDEQSLGSRGDPEDSENITLQVLRDYWDKMGVHVCPNGFPKSSAGRDIEELIDTYKTLKGRKDDVGPEGRALQTANKSRRLAIEICRELESMENRNISKYRAGKAIITDKLACQIYRDTVPAAFLASRDLSGLMS